MIDPKKYNYHWERRLDMDRRLTGPFDLYSHGYLDMVDNIESKNQAQITRNVKRYNSAYASMSKNEKFYYRGQMAALKDAKRISAQFGTSLFDNKIKKTRKPLSRKSIKTAFK